MIDRPDKDGYWPLAVVDGYTAQPCVGSGLCCKKALCSIGLAKHGSIAGPCPSLVERDGRHWCGEILNAPTVEEAARLRANLYVGAGCCMPIGNTVREEILRRKP